MPFEAHPHLITPPDDTILWRYSDFAKFMDHRLHCEDCQLLAIGRYATNSADTG